MAFYLFFYRMFLLLYGAGIRIASLKNNKAVLWLKGRQHWQQELQQKTASQFTKDQPAIWMHCASLGEFEQGRPVLEKLKQANPKANFIVTFFSPSGYEIRKNYSGAQVISYLPLDSPANARRFLQIVQPSLVLWVKYEYWYFYLSQVKQQQIPLLLVSGIFREDHVFFKWYGGLHREMLHCFTQLFVQTDTSKALAATVINTQKINVTGDTRFDRVIEIRERFEPVDTVEKWLAGATKVMVCGSTWDEDEKELSHYIKRHTEIKFIIAPHNVNAEEIQELLSLFPEAILYSRWIQESFTSNNHILIIDTIGILSRLYAYATVTFVGGGFGADGIHNVLEAAVWGKPVLHGPEYQKFAEAKDLVAAGASFAAEDALQLEKWLDKLFNDPVFYQKAATTAKEYVYAKRGATDSIVQYIQANRLLTKS